MNNDRRHVDARKERALLSTKMYIVKNDNDTLFEIKGESDRIYNVQIIDKDLNKFRCSCPDFLRRQHAKGPCKHIYYILLKVLPRTSSKLKLKEVDNNDDCNCVICYDDILIDNTIFKCICCKGIFHNNCMSIWTSRNSSCPLCRHLIIE